MFLVLIQSNSNPEAPLHGHVTNLTDTFQHALNLLLDGSIIYMQLKLIKVNYGTDSINTSR